MQTLRRSLLLEILEVRGTGGLAADHGLHLLCAGVLRSLPSSEGRRTLYVLFHRDGISVLMCSTLSQVIADFMQQRGGEVPGLHSILSTE